jgi:hypothetical protein
LRRCLMRVKSNIEVGLDIGRGRRAHGKALPPGS